MTITNVFSQVFNFFDLFLQGVQMVFLGLPIQGWAWILSILIVPSLLALIVPINALKHEPAMRQKAIIYGALGGALSLLALIISIPFYVRVLGGDPSIFMPRFGVGGFNFYQHVYCVVYGAVVLCYVFLSKKTFGNINSNTPQYCSFSAKRVFFYAFGFGYLANLEKAGLLFFVYGFSMSHELPGVLMIVYPLLTLLLVICCSGVLLYGFSKLFLRLCTSQNQTPAMSLWFAILFVVGAAWLIAALL